METKKQSYLEKYVDFLHEDGKGILENDLAVQIALGYMELKNPSPSLQPQQEYTQQELGLGIRFEDPQRRETRKHLGKLVEISDNHIWTNLPDDHYWIKTLEDIEQQLITYETEDVMGYTMEYGI